VKGSPGPIKAKVQATRKKQMVLGFFNSKGLIYTNFVPRGWTLNSAYIIEALTHFLKALKGEEADDDGRDPVVSLG
jgi:hypothetical protein